MKQMTSKNVDTFYYLFCGEAIAIINFEPKLQEKMKIHDAKWVTTTQMTCKYIDLFGIWYNFMHSVN